jgi:sucrose-6-phosphate hydrolase SacC (GH32 family)
MADGLAEIRVLVDRLSLENFGNRGEVSLTNFARKNDSVPPLELRAEGRAVFLGSIEIHELDSIWK